MTAARGKPDGEFLHESQATCPLPSETYPVVLESLDAHSIARFRRCANLSNFKHEAHAMELRARVHELLACTKFPFTHAAYVLGLNGRLYSYDTDAINHYGIPEDLPKTICRFFRLSFPGVAFTTIRIQKLASAVNFGGHHRTLAFSMADCRERLVGNELAVESSPEESPYSAPLHDEKFSNPLPALHSPLEHLVSVQTCKQLSTEAASPKSFQEDDQGYVLCLGAGCVGGRGVICNDINKRNWHTLAKPSHVANWISFPLSSWMQWYWPEVGDLYSVLIMCETPRNVSKLTKSERRLMARTGFELPQPEWDMKQTRNEEDTATEDEATESVRSSCFQASKEDGSISETPHTSQTPTRRSRAQLGTALRILKFDGDSIPTIDEIEAAFRRTVRIAHPDKGANDSEDMKCLRARTQGWAMSQINWARKVLRDVAAAGVEAESAVLQPDGNLLMLAPP